jgi:uncharacterized protein YqgV (UPF0045/DUF77 family)
MSEEKNMMENTVDINDVSTNPVVEEVDPNILSVNLMCGMTLDFDAASMDWGDIYSRINEIDDNIMTFKSMVNDIIRPVDISEDDRNNRAETIFASALEFLKNSGIDNISYDVRPNITIIEKALLVCMDNILILEALIHHARIVATMNVDTSSLIDSMIDRLTDSVDLDGVVKDAVDFAKQNPMNLDESDEETDDVEVDA